MKAIIAVNKENYIGLNDELPWRCSEDLKHFKRMTDGCTLLVGHNTSKKMPPLPGRIVIVDERGVTLTEGIDWCIGGRKTYEKYAHLFTELHISRINNTSVGDTEFPDLSSLNPNCKVFEYQFEENKKA